MTSRAQEWTRNVGGGVLPQPSNNIDTTLSELQVWSSNSSQNKVSAKPIATRLGFVVLHCSRSGGPDTVPSTAYEQQLETPMKIKHILRGRFWTQLRIQNSACRRFTMPPFTFRSIRRHRTPSKKKEKGWVGGTKQKQVDTRRRGTTVIAFTFK